jgi:hypothetical protein
MHPACTGIIQQLFNTISQNWIIICEVSDKKIGVNKTPVQDISPTSRSARTVLAFSRSMTMLLPTIGVTLPLNCLSDLTGVMTIRSPSTKKSTLSLA